MRKWPAIALALLLILGGPGCSGTAGGRQQAGLRVGVPDDTAGMLVDYAARLSSGTIEADTVSAFELRDCCASKSQIALAAADLDAAVLCPSAARDLVEKDARFEIVGPLVAGSDVVVLRPGVPHPRIGVTQNRTYQEAVARSVAGTGAQTVPMLTTSLPYAYEKGAVDGIVLDVLKALDVDGERLAPETGEGEGAASYVLVARSEVTAEERFARFLAQLDRAARDLSDASELREEMSRFLGRDVSEEEVEEWDRLNVRLLRTSRKRTS